MLYFEKILDYESKLSCTGLQVHGPQSLPDLLLAQLLDPFHKLLVFYKFLSWLNDHVLVFNPWPYCGVWISKASRIFKRDALEKHEFDLMFLCIKPSNQLGDGKGSTFIITDVDFLSKLVGDGLHIFLLVYISPLC